MLLEKAWPINFLEKFNKKCGASCASFAVQVWEDKMKQKKAKLYLKSSVINMYFQDDAPYLRDLTRQFWRDVLPHFDIYISGAEFMKSVGKSDKRLWGSGNKVKCQEEKLQRRKKKKYEREYSRSFPDVKLCKTFTTLLSLREGNRMANNVSWRDCRGYKEWRRRD